MTREHDPVQEQDDKNLDDEFKRIEAEQKLKEKQNESSQCFAKTSSVMIIRLPIKHTVKII